MNSQWKPPFYMHASFPCILHIFPHHPCIVYAHSTNVAHVLFLVNAVGRAHCSWIAPVWARRKEWRAARQYCIHARHLAEPSLQTAVCCGQHSHLVGQHITSQQNHQYITNHTITVSPSMAPPCSTKPAACLPSRHLLNTHHHLYHHTRSRRSHSSYLMHSRWASTTLGSLTLTIQHLLSRATNWVS